MSSAKSPIWALAPNGAGLSLSPSRLAPCTGHNPPAWSLNYPFVESDFVLCCWQQSLTLNVTAYFTAMKKSLCSAGSLFLGVSGQPLGEVFCWFIPRVPHLCPRLYASLHPRPWVFLSLIPPSFYHSSPGAQSTLFLHQGGGPGSVPKPLRSVPRCHLLHPCGWKTAGRTCVCSVLGLVTYPPSVWISDT